MEQWLTVKEVSELLGITEQAVRKNATSGEYGEVKYETSSAGGGRGGKALQINLTALPTDLQIAYLKGYGQSVQDVVGNDSDEWDSAPQWKRKVAAERLEILAAWERFIAANTGAKTTQTKDFIRTWKVVNGENKLCQGTLYRWKKLYKEGGRCALLPDWGKKNSGGNKRAIDPEALGFFLKLYGTKQQRSVADCYEDLVLIAKERGWRIPSVRTVCRIVNEDMPKATLVHLREGEEAWRNKCAPYILRDPDSVKAGQVWVGDHQRLDLFCKGPNGKPVRPWLTAWLDFRSWKPLGWIISYQSNTDTIMAAFANAALDRAIGLPNDIYIDNGNDYSSYEFAGRGNRRQAKVDEKTVRSLVAELGIAPHFAIPANARAKVIERFYGIVADKFCRRFVTYCGSDNKKRPEGLDDILKDPNQVPSLKEIQEAFSGWVTHMYNKTKSQGEGRKNECPDETFQRTRGLIRLAPESALRLCLMRHTQAMTVQRLGVTLFGQWYYNPNLINHLGEQVYVRYRDADMARVFVFSMKDEYLMEATLQSRAAAIGVDKEIIREAKKLEKEAKRLTRSHAEIAEKIAITPDPLERVIQRRAEQQDRPPDPEQPNVIEPVRLARQMVAAAKEIDMAKAVGAEAVGNETTRYKEFYMQSLFSGPREVKSSNEDGAKKALTLLKAVLNK